MPQTFLEQEINKLKELIIELEGMVSEATINAVDALLDNDEVKSKRVYLNDKSINKLRFKIEDKCLIIIATQQPLASDLRVLASILEVVTELERMGDYAKGIAKINLLIEKKSTKAKSILPIKEMAEITVNMLKKAIKAFIEEDAETARQIPKDDDKVDELFNLIVTGLLEEMLDKKKNITLANNLQWAAHNMERMADRVVNICERTIFIVTGEMHELEESDDEWIVSME